MAKAKIVADQEGRYYGVRITCPGCDQWHVLATDWTPPGYERSHGMRADVWTFNGDLNAPVFGPSLLCQSNRYVPPVTPENQEEYEKGPWSQERVPHVCHSFIGCNGAQPGQIVYLGDCTHSLRGQVVDLPEIHEGPDDGN